MTGLLGLDKTTMDDLSLIGMSPEQLQTHFTHTHKLLQHIFPVSGEREMHISCSKKEKYFGLSWIKVYQSFANSG